MIQKELIDDLQLKWGRIQQAMQAQHADACLLSVDVNLYYTTGRIFSGYFYLPAEGAPWFFVKRPTRTNSRDIRRPRYPDAGKTVTGSRRVDIQRLYPPAIHIQPERNR